MSEIKVNKLTPRTACGTTTLGDSGDTINIPAGVTISNNGTATGFGATGAVNWDVSSIKTVTFTATAGVGYFVDTATTGAVTVNLPAGTAGDVVGVADYANNFNTANCTLAPNGTEKIAGQALDSGLTTDGVAITLVYVDATKGWIVTDSGNQTDSPTALYVAATGGSITTCGNYKIHTFTGPGTFTVTCAGNGIGSSTLDYLVVAGGGGSARDNGAGAGAGGARFFGTCIAAPYPASPLIGPAALTAVVQAYPLTVGGGGAPGNTPGGGPGAPGSRGTDSTFDTITSTGGGGSNGDGQPFSPNMPGGSGGGRGQGAGPIGIGNTPPVSPSQGNDGAGDGGNPGGGGGGGGFLAAGSNRSGDNGGAGGVGGGFPTSFFGSLNGVPSGSFRYFAGGGGGGTGQPGSGTGGAGGLGGGGAGGPGNGNPGTIGTQYSGGGAGGGGQAGEGATGGDGIVVIRYRYQ